MNQIKELAPIIWEEIQKSKNILLHCHPSPDGDSYGSALGLMHFLKSLGKNVTVIKGDSPLFEMFEVLPGFDQIVEKNYLEINSKDYDLFIIADSADITRVSSLGEVIFPENMKTIVIDNHTTNPGFGEINFIDKSYSSACEMIYWLMKEWKVSITPEIAICLFVGIYTDSGGFKYFPTNEKTFLAGAELVKIYPEYHKVILKLENSDRPQRLYYQGLTIEGIKTFFNNQVALSFISFEKLKEKGISVAETGSLANILLSVKDWLVCATMVEK